jgi:hypothetical protein
MDLGELRFRELAGCCVCLAVSGDWLNILDSSFDSSSSHGNLSRDDSGGSSQFEPVDANCELECWSLELFRARIHVNS